MGIMISHHGYNNRYNNHVKHAWKCGHALYMAKYGSWLKTQGIKNKDYLRSCHIQVGSRLFSFVWVPKALEPPWSVFLLRFCFPIKIWDTIYNCNAKSLTVVFFNHYSSLCHTGWLSDVTGPDGGRFLTWVKVSENSTHIPQ